MADEFGVEVDARSLEELTVKFRRALHEGRRQVDRDLGVIGEAMSKESKRSLAGVSTSVPPTIHSVPNPAKHEVVLTAEGSALAWVYTKGNKVGRKARTFQHPVFAPKGSSRYADRESWPTQKRVAFFQVARRRLAPWTVKTLGESWKHGLSRAGIKVD